MPKVRIVLLTERITLDYDRYEEVEKILGCGLTEWEEISQENLEFLRKHDRELLELIRKNDRMVKTAFVICDSESVASRIKSLNDLIEEEARRLDAAAKKRDKEMAEYDLRKKKMALERKKRQLEKLKAELGEVE